MNFLKCRIIKLGEHTYVCAFKFTRKSTSRRQSKLGRKYKSNKHAHARTKKKKVNMRGHGDIFFWGN